MAKILLITNYYYPKQSIATNRMVAFAKYLKEFGHEIFVLTEAKESKKSIQDVEVYYVSNRNIFNKADTNIRENKFKHYVKCAYNLILSYASLDSKAWVSRATKQAINIIKKENIDVIISSYPTMDVLFVAKKLKKEFPKLKWIADMRDALWASTMPSFFVKHNVAKGKKLLCETDILVSVCKPTLDGYKELLKENEKICFYEIRNGYDFELTEPAKVEPAYMNIVYSGSFYGQIKPTNFFEALKDVIDGRNIKVNIIGNKAPIKVPSSLLQCVRQTEWMSYSDVVAYLKNKADLLLLIIPKGREKGVFSGKIFDYIACLKPVLGLVPKDDIAANLLREVNACYIAENENVAQIKEQIIKAYSDWENMRRFDFNKDVILKHHRKEQVRILNEILNKWE